MAEALTAQEELVRHLCVFPSHMRFIDVSFRTVILFVSAFDVLITGSRFDSARAV